jgi:enoyl-CoA hydratase/carnithine racemase
MSLILTTIDEAGTATITLNDEQNLNAMSEAMAVEFKDAVQALRAHEGLRAVVLRGAGRSFSAGGHLEMLREKQQKTERENHAGMLSFYNSFLSITSLNVPIIAAMHGAAVGAGLCVACAADIRIATDATKLGFTFLKLGLHPGMGCTFFLPRIVGQARATELLATGRMISSTEALSMGLLSKVCGAEDLDSTVASTIKEISHCGRLATTQLIETMRGDLSTLSDALDREASCQAKNYKSAEFKEGLQAIIEKRSPSFS